MERSAHENEAGGENKKYKSDELMVKFREGVPDEQKKAIHEKNGAKRIKEFHSLRWENIKLRKDMSVDEGISLYAALPEVEYAEPNFIYTVQEMPNDPLLGQLWNIQNTGQTGGTPGADIKASEAWGVTTGSQSVVVAVIDTGDDPHP